MLFIPSCGILERRKSACPMAVSTFRSVEPFMEMLQILQVRLLAWQWARWLSMLGMAAATAAASRLHHLPWLN